MLKKLFFSFFIISSFLFAEKAEVLSVVKGNVLHPGIQKFVILKDNSIIHIEDHFNQFFYMIKPGDILDIEEVGDPTDKQVSVKLKPDKILNGYLLNVYPRGPSSIKEVNTLHITAEFFKALIDIDFLDDEDDDDTIFLTILEDGSIFICENIEFDKNDKVFLFEDLEYDDYLIINMTKNRICSADKLGKVISSKKGVEIENISNISYFYGLSLMKFKIDDGSIWNTIYQRDIEKNRKLDFITFSLDENSLDKEIPIKFIKLMMLDKEYIFLNDPTGKMPIIFGYRDATL